MKPSTCTIVAKEELAIWTARLHALIAITSMSDRKLALFHQREALERLQRLEIDMHDYSDGDDADSSLFDADDKERIIENLEQIEKHLVHVRAIVVSGATAPEPSQKGGAS